LACEQLFQRLVLAFKWFISDHLNNVEN
jgi:hypothetical protein